MKYKRVLLKLSGELFGGEQKRGIDFKSIKKLAEYLHNLKKTLNLEIAVVVGGGNLFRGREVTDSEFDQATADYIGMLGTVMNALALQVELEKVGSDTRVMSAIAMDTICEPFIRRKAISHLGKDRIVILAGGTGSPFFTTDSAAALKACELNCEIILKGSDVDGVFSADPKLDKDAKLYSSLTFQEALEKGLTVMDNTAFALCQREKIPVIVFNIKNLENIEKIISGEKIGTLVTR